MIPVSITKKRITSARLDKTKTLHDRIKIHDHSLKLVLVHIWPCATAECGNQDFKLQIL